MTDGWSRGRAGAELAGRLLIAVLFYGGFVQKLLDPAGAQALLDMAGLPVILSWPAALFNLAAAIALTLGLWVRPVALALAAYCIATSAFHLMLDDPWQTTIAVKNWSIAGGCLILAAQGPGPWRLRL